MPAAAVPPPGAAGVAARAAAAPAAPVARPAGAAPVAPVARPAGAAAAGQVAARGAAEPAAARAPLARAATRDAAERRRRRHGRRSGRRRHRRGRTRGRRRASVRPGGHQQRLAAALLLVRHRLRRALLGHRSDGAPQQHRAFHLQGRRRRDAEGRLHDDHRHRELRSRHGAIRRHAHRRALSPDRGGPGQFAARVSDRRRRRSPDGAPAGTGALDRGGGRFNQRRLRHARHVERRRLLPDRESLGHVRIRRSARRRRRSQHDRRVGPRHGPQLRRRHDRHAAADLRADVDERYGQRLELRASSRRRS